MPGKTGQLKITTMIEARELRINNLISHNGLICTVEIINGELDQIDFLGYDDFYYSDKTENLEPIPLTEEWLLKFGFEKIYSTKVRSVFDFSEDLRFGYLDNFGFSNTSSGVTFIGNKFEHIKYVHQLQNLYFALKLEELNIISQ